MISPPHQVPKFHIMQYIISSMDSPEIDTIPIRRRLAVGLDECPPDDRCLSWLIILGIYTKNPADWPRRLHQLKEEYRGYVQDLRLTDWHTKDLPLVMTSEYDLDLPDKHQMIMIHGDIVRTGRNIFYLPPMAVGTPQGDQADDIFFLFSQHFRQMERILYVFSLLNCNIGYMQGFNELIQPIYYVLVQARELFNNDYFTIEVLCFNMLLNLLMNTDLVSFFKTNSNQSGTLQLLESFTDLLHKYQPDAAEVIADLNIHPACYCFRWFALLYTQEFQLPDVIWIWDAILSRYDKVTDFAFYIGLGLINQMKKQIKHADFATVINLFQNLNSADVKSALKYASNLWNKNHC